MRCRKSEILRYKVIPSESQQKKKKRKKMDWYEDWRTWK